MLNDRARRLLACAAVAVAIAAAPGLGQGTAPPERLVPHGEPPDLYLLFTGDVIGYIEDCGCKKNPAGGLARRAWVTHQIRDRFPASPLLLLDSGNFSDLPTAEGDAKTVALIEGMGRMGYAAANVGERDIRMGYDEFVGRTRDAAFPFLSANLVRQDTRQPVFQSRLLTEAVSADGTARRRVGVTGVVRHNPILLKAGPGESNMVISHPVEPVRREVAALRAEGAETIVVLAALHKDDATTIAREVAGIDFIIGSYGGVFTADAEQVGDTWLIYSGNQGKRLGETRAFETGGSGMRQHTRMHFLTRMYPSDPEMLEFVTSRAKKGAAAAAPAGGNAAPRSPYVGSLVCGRCHESEYDEWSSTPHARALETLDEDDKSGDASCVRCHVTGAERDGGFETRQATPDLAHVGCESCHGPGREHSYSRSRGYGPVGVPTCAACHDTEHSPDFDYYSDLPRVTHGARAAR